MSKDLWDDVRDAFSVFSDRLDAAPELVQTALKSCTWDLFSKGKMPNQALADIKAKASELEAKIQAHQRARHAR